jgi:hypothetical protein
MNHKFELGQKVLIVDGEFKGHYGTIVEFRGVQSREGEDTEYTILCEDGSEILTRENTVSTLLEESVQYATREGIIDGPGEIREWTYQELQDYPKKRLREIMAQYEAQHLEEAAGIKKEYTPLDLEYYDEDEMYAGYLVEMATIKGGFMSIRLTVFEDEGPGYPHFHFYKGIAASNRGIPREKRQFGGCICFKEAAYFAHRKHKETMTPKEIDALIEFLNAKYNDSMTNWQFMIEMWNSQNDELKPLPSDLPIPEYKSNMPTIQDKK